MYTPYDFNQSIAHRAEYVEERLKAGMPVVGVSYAGGVLLFTVKRSQRKIFEIYDELIYSAIGNQTDVETVRLAAIDFCHQEGFARSPDDVSIQRLVGFAISPPLKRAFGDPMTTPNVLRAIFAELGSDPAKDQFFVLNYDGEFTTHAAHAAAGPSESSEEAMTAVLAEAGEVADLSVALELAAKAWRAGMSRPTEGDEDGEAPDPLAEALKTGTLEAGVLERSTSRESKFRLLSAEELKPVAG